MSAKCYNCNGTGRVPTGQSYRGKCDNCWSGVINTSMGPAPCPKCRNSGYLWYPEMVDCPTCSGRGSPVCQYSVRQIIEIV